jgi:hypothetical protein
LFPNIILETTALDDASVDVLGSDSVSITVPNISATRVEYLITTTTISNKSQETSHYIINILLENIQNGNMTSLIQKLSNHHHQNISLSNITIISIIITSTTSSPSITPSKNNNYSSSNIFQSNKYFKIVCYGLAVIFILLIIGGIIWYIYYIRLERHLLKTVVPMRLAYKQKLRTKSMRVKSLEFDRGILL